MELKGTVTLDDDTMSKLKDSIREEVMKDINRDGLYYEEVVNYLQGCTLKGYLNVLTSTIDSVTVGVDEDSLSFASDRKLLERLRVIAGVLKL